MPFKISPEECEDGYMYGKNATLFESVVLIDPATKMIYGNAYAATPQRMTSKVLADMIAQHGPPSHAFTDGTWGAHVIWPESVPKPRCIFFDDIGPVRTERLKRFVSRLVFLLKLKVLARRGRAMARMGSYLKRGLASEAAAALSTHAKYMPKRVKRV